MKQADELEFRHVEPEQPLECEVASGSSILDPWRDLRPGVVGRGSELKPCEQTPREAGLDPNLTNEAMPKE